MLKTEKSKFIFIYFLIGIATIFADYYNNKELLLLLKPLICFSLIFFLFDNRKIFTNIVPLYIALFCGLVGDFLLIFPQYFVGGLIAFLIGHICYISVFIRQNNIKNYLTKLITWLIIAIILIYLTLFYNYIKLSLGELQLPVLIYMLVISFMFMSSYLRKKHNGYYLVILGAFNFVISDSVIAISQFISPFLYSNQIILITYIVAQFLIIFGVTRRYRVEL
jgi:uncharacterized membrane protein YhhN